MSNAAPATAVGAAPPGVGARVGGGFAGDDYRPPALARTVALAAAVGVLATGAYGVYLGFFGSQNAAWFVVAFEGVSMLAGGFALAVGLGRFASAPGMTLLCAAGVVGAGAFLANLGSGGRGFTAGQVLSAWFLRAQAGLTVALLAASAWSVLARNPGPAMRSLTKAAMFGVPLVAILAGVFLTRRQLMGLPGGVKMLGGLVVFLLVTGLVAGAVHCAIRAFEACDEDPALR